jgi:hypothetical protein
MIAKPLKPTLKPKLGKECVCPTYPRPTTHCTKLTANVILQKQFQCQKSINQIELLLPHNCTAGCWTYVVGRRDTLPENK